MIFSVLLYVLLSALQAKLSVLEPNARGVLFGAWYDRMHSESPAAMQSRAGLSPFALWQTHLNLTGILSPAVIDSIAAQIQSTNSNAIVVLAVYPSHGFSNISAKSVSVFVECIKRITDSGRQVMIR